MDRYSCSLLQVAGGWRETIPDDMPAEIADIITACWAQDMSDRPSAFEVEQRLKVRSDGHDSLSACIKKQGIAHAARVACAATLAAQTGKADALQDSGRASMHDKPLNLVLTPAVSKLRAAEDEDF